MASLFPPDKYRSAMISLIDAMTVIINQRLVKSTDGKRVAVREWIAFDDALKTRLMLMEPREIGPYLAEYINDPANDNARSILTSADRLYAEGRIDKLRLTEIRQSAGHDLAELTA
jgi:defect-in-organelle-trafficking protein DotB